MASGAPIGDSRRIGMDVLRRPQNRKKRGCSPPKRMFQKVIACLQCLGQVDFGRPTYSRKRSRLFGTLGPLQPMWTRYIADCLQSSQVPWRRCRPSQRTRSISQSTFGSVSRSSGEGQFERLSRSCVDLWTQSRNPRQRRELRLAQRNFFSSI
jgi:hypothetical protein